MTYFRKCIWCGNDFETEDAELDYCSVECVRAEEIYMSKQMDEDAKDREYYGSEG